MLVGCMTLAHGLAATEGDSSLSKSNNIESNTTVPTTTALAQDDELRQQVSNARESIRTLTDSLAVSNIEVEACRQKYAELQSRVEALGIASGKKDRAKLEQRLLNATSDLRAMRQERDRYRDQVLGLSEAVLHLLKTSTGIDAQARMEVEAQLRGSKQLASTVDSLPTENATLMDGRVVSVKEEWSLIVGNIGEKQGVKIGMPMRVIRDDQLIAKLRVVDVRQRVCGAVTQELGSEKIRVGDRLQADAR